MEVTAQRREFYRQLVQFGPGADAKVPAAWANRIPQWKQRFYHTGDPTLATVPRLVNHFKLGADPEFVFQTPNGERFDPANLGLKTGLFAGADQNGRLVELRPKPARSALRVLASLLDSLRWLVMMRPDTLQFEWGCSPFMFNDGVGGHIHFGRKTATRATEVTALDAVCSTLERLKVYPADQVSQRRKGDAFNQQYGVLGQYRPQLHGYEYRVFPSWLDSPWMAFFHLVVSKLAAYDPSLVISWQSNQTPSVQQVRNLLAFYKGQDDDALLAYTAFQRVGLPKHKGGDFKARWGLNFEATHSISDIAIFPCAITPEETSVKEVFELLSAGTALKPREPKPTWNPTTCPAGFSPLIDRMQVVRQAGMGELLWDLVEANNMRVDILPGDPGKVAFTISAKLAERMPLNWKAKIKKALPGCGIKVSHEARNRKIYIGRDWRRNNPKGLQDIKRILTSGLFPLWKVQDANSDVLSQWEKQKSEKKVATPLGKVLVAESN